MKNLTIIGLFLFFHLISIQIIQANNNLKDSLLVLLKNEKNDTSRCKVYIQLAKLYESDNLDSVIYWNEKSINELDKIIDKSDVSGINRIKYLKAKSLQGMAFVYYYRDDMPKTFEILNSVEKILESIGDKKSLADIYSNYGILHQNLGNYDEAKKFLLEAEKIDVELNEKEGLAGCKSNIGLLYSDQADYPNALKYLLDAVKIYSEINSAKGLGQCFNNIGIIYYRQGNYSLALDYCNKSIENRRVANDINGLANTYTTKGNIFSSLSNTDSCIFYYNEVLEMHKKTGNLSGQAIVLNNMATEMLDNNKVDDAMQNFQEALKISIEIDAKLIQANVYNNIGRVYNSKSDYKNAIGYSNKSLLISKELNLLNEQKTALRYLSEDYEKIGDYKSALSYHQQYKRMADSIFNEKSSKQVKEMEAKYQSAKKQLEIKKLEQDKVLQNETIERQKAENRKQQIIIIASISVILLILIFSILLYRLFIQKKKANKLLELRNVEISQQKEEIETQRDMLAVRNEEVMQQKEEIEAQRDEIEIQKDVVTAQKHQIEFIHTEITQSIQYAKRIQESILPEKSIIDKYFPNNFILFKPKDNVSGDFYWWAEIENILIVSVADCTGHGVPGAFMSMLGTSFLREIVLKEYMTNPGIILRRLRKEIIKTLKQKGESGEQKDGMDMSLIAINIQAQSQKPQIQIEEMKCHSERSEESIISEPDSSLSLGMTATEFYEAQWAGANNPLWIVSSSMFEVSGSKENEQHVLDNLKHETSSHKLFELKADKMPIAIYEKLDNFTTHELKLYKGDSIYLMSDGFADQFGGPKGKKFLSKNLKSLLVENAELPMIEQYKLLEKHLTDWRYYGLNKFEQVDDITLMGITI